MLQSTPLDNIIIILITMIITNPIINKEGWPRAWQCSKHFTHVMLNHLVLTVTLTWVQLLPHFSDEKTQAQLGEGLAQLIYTFQSM